jgi:hypothetical protein
MVAKKGIMMLDDPQNFQFFFFQSSCQEESFLFRTLSFFFFILAHAQVKKSKAKKIYWLYLWKDCHVDNRVVKQMGGNPGRGSECQGGRPRGYPNGQDPA